MSLRKKLRSPVPVLDLVQRFDSQGSNTSSPVVSPTLGSAPGSQMAKIAERLMQSQANKPQRSVARLFV